MSKFKLSSDWSELIETSEKYSNPNGTMTMQEVIEESFKKIKEEERIEVKSYLKNNLKNF